MSNNGWIKYSEQKPTCLGKYLVAYSQNIGILMYVTQNVICECNELDYQIDKLRQAWREEVDGKMTPVCVKCGQIDGKVLKENVFYTLKDGEFVEEEDQ